jgi:hypothetical protein
MGWSLPCRTQCSFGKYSRSVELVAGARYQVVPLNPLAKKHRGRFCVLLRLGWEGPEPNGPADFLVVKFEDTGRVAKVSWGDLLPAP